MPPVNQSVLYDVTERYRLRAEDLGKDPVCEIRHLGIDFGGLTAVNDFNLMIGRTEIDGLIGPNGAGKTTVFNLLTNVYEATRGSVLLDGVNTKGLKTREISNLGIGRTFQNIRLFRGLSVLDNVLIGMNSSMRYRIPGALFRLPGYWKEEAKSREKAMELLSIFDMQRMADWKAGSLPYGAQRRLEIVRALATEPKLLLLDEPAAGMNPSETTELMENIRSIRDTFQIAILLIEHDMNLVMGVCDGIVVLDYGNVIAKGTPEQIIHDPAVIEAYLGRTEDADAES